MAEGRQGIGFIILDDVNMNDSIEIIDDTDESVDTFQRLAADVENRRQEREAKTQNARGMRKRGKRRKRGRKRKNKMLHNKSTEEKNETIKSLFNSNRQEFHTRREVERVHGHLNLQNADQEEAREAATAVQHFSSRNRLAVLDRVQPQTRSSECEGDLPESLRITNHCPIINCGLGFSNQRQLKRHMRSAQHSPCKPCRHMPNGHIVCDQVAYLCPVCGQLYNSLAECLEHMNGNDHNVFMEPLRLGGYLCPQCLQVFPSWKLCREHMESNFHFRYSYPFADDSGRAKPLKVPVKFIEKLEDACGSVTWTLKCITCDTVVDDASYQEHVYQVDHILSAETDQTAADVFINFIKSYTCIQCLRLFDDQYVAVDTIHDCGGTVKGLIIENDCSTFEEYMRRTCLLLSSDADSAQDLMDDFDLQIVVPAVAETIGVTQQTKRRISVIAGPVLKRSRMCSADELSSRASLLSLDDNSDNSDNTETMQASLKRASPEPLNVGSKPITPKRRSNIDSQDVIHVVVLDDQEVEDGENVSHDEAEGATAKTPELQKTNNLQMTSPASEKGKKSKKRTPCKEKTPLKETSSSSDSSTKEQLPSTSPSNSTSSCASKVTADRNNNVPSNRSVLPTFNSSSRLPYSSAPTNTINQALLNIPNQIFNCHSYRTPYFPSASYWNRFPNQYAAAARTWFSNPRINFTNAPKPTPYQFTAVSSGNSLLRFPRHRQLNKRPPQRVTSFGRAELPDRKKEPGNLDKMKQIIFLDLDNWPSFFKRLPEPLPNGTFVWGFFGGANVWNEPIQNAKFFDLKRKGEFYLHPQCGRTKDAADFALVMTVGRMDEKLPKHIPFTILSGDHGFIEVERQMSVTERKTVVIDPHHKREDLLYKQIATISN